MNSAITVCHGDFGKLSFVELNRPKVLHTNREAQLLFLIDGDDATLKINDVPVTLSKNRAVAIDSYMPNEVHVSQSSTSSKILSLFVNTFWYATRFNSGDPEWLSFANRSFIVDANIREHLDHLVALVQPPAPEKQPGYHLALETRVRHLCSTCFERSNILTSSVSTENPIRKSDSRIRKSLVIMNNPVRNNLPLDEIARAAGLSRPHFYRLFRDNLGVTPNVYMNMLKTEYAIDRLIFSDQPVTSIALELGFASQASFTRFFGANLGIAPTDYRRLVCMPPGMRAAAIGNAGDEAKSAGQVEPVPHQVNSNMKFSLSK